MSSRDRDPDRIRDVDRSRDRERPRDHDRDRRDRGSRWGDSKSSGFCLFVGNLNTKVITERDISNLFQKHGKVTDVVLQDGFAYVTFEREEDSKRAMEKENGALLQESKMSIRVYNSVGSDRGRDRERDRRRSPPAFRGSGRPLPYDRDPRDMSPPPPRDRDRRSPPRQRSRDRDRSYSSYNRDESMGRGYRDYPAREESRYPPPQPYAAPAPERSYPPPRSAPEPARSAAARSSPYDTAVIAMEEGLVPYAEMIERRLQRAAALVTHIVVLKEEAHVAPCVDDLTHRGVLFAIIVNRMNEQLASCTLRLLYGTPQEHRNMPLDDALQFVVRNFESHMGSQRDRKRVEGPRDVSRLPPGFIAPSDGVAYILHLLGDCRMLTVEELTEVEDFVRLRKERLLEVEGGQPPRKRAFIEPEAPKVMPSAGLGGLPVGVSPAGARDEKAIIAQQAELQAKILSILNPGAPSGTPAAGGHGQGMSAAGITGYGGGMKQDMGGQQQQGGGSLNLNNPQIQKALDTLLQGGGLNVGSGSSAAGDMSRAMQAQQHQQMPGQGGMNMSGYGQQQRPNMYGGQGQSLMRPPAPQQQNYMGQQRMRFN